MSERAGDAGRPLLSVLLIAYQQQETVAEAIAGTLAQTALNQALREAEVAVVMPFEFLRLIWAGMIGYFIFAELPGVWTWVGGAMIIGSTSYIAYRESLQRRKQRDLERTGASS